MVAAEPRPGSGIPFVGVKVWPRPYSLPLYSVSSTRSLKYISRILKKVDAVNNESDPA